MKSVLLASTLLLSTSIMAHSTLPLEQQIGDIEISEVSAMSLQKYNGGGRTPIPTPQVPGPTQTPIPLPNPMPDTPAQAPTTPGATFNDNVEKTGKVIQIARDVVALGESIYELVKKGRPTNVTEYAPISVVPRDPMSKEYVEPFDMEGFSFPVEKSYVARVKDGTGREAVTFNYKVIYSYGGSYNGVGKYLTNVIIIPGSVVTRFGWDFNASMKLSGIMNHGSKANPVAGVMVTIKYQMNSFASAFERNDTVHITGNGEIRSLMSGN